VPEDSFSLLVNHDNKKAIEATSSKKYLIEATKSITINVLNIVDGWNA
jgi:hypothetical protein